MKTNYLIGIAALTAGLLMATPAFAKGNSSGKGGQGGGQGGGQDAGQYGYSQSAGGQNFGAGSCDGSGPGQGVPLKDGSGKAAKGKGNSAGNGTPLNDGSGSGNGGKGYGKSSDGTCPKD